MDRSRTDVVAQPVLSEAQKAEIRAYLHALISSGTFGNSARKAQLLGYLIEHALAGQEVSEYAVGLDVFEKPPSFDPRTDSVVRAEVSRIRQKLREHYSGLGRADPVVIGFPQRSYLPAFTFRKPDAQPEPATGQKAKHRFFRLLAVAAVAAAAFAGWVQWKRAAGSRSIESLAVLPFANLSGHPENEYLADGLTEELTNDLAQRPDLRVVARTSAFQFKSKAIDVREVGRELNVDAVLEGSVDKQGDRIRVTAQLNRTSNGYHIWSRSFEARSADTMALQDEMARSIAEAFGRIGKAPAPHALATSSNAEARDLFLQGSYQRSLNTPDSYRRSLALLQKSVEKDPAYAAAYYRIGLTEMDLVHITAGAPRDGYAQMRSAFRKAIELAPDFADAHAGLAVVLYENDWNWPAAENEILTALKDGGHGAGTFYGWALATRGRFREAQQQFRVASDWDPIGPGPRFNQMIAFYLEHRYSDARSVLNGMLQMNPNALDVHLFLGLMAAIQHDCATAAHEFKWSAQKYPMPVTKFGLAVAAACRGDLPSARAYLAEMSQSKGSNYISPYQLALGYAMIHDKDSAFFWLRKSAEDREGQILYLKYEPVFDEIRGDPRYLALERTVGLEF